MKTTRTLIRELANEYLEDANYHRGIISGEWIDRVSDELNLINLTDLELSNMWDMVWMTLECEYSHHRINNEFDEAMKYLDVQSAFTEVVNREARIRRTYKKL